MYLFKRAYLYIKKQKAKSLLLFTLFFLIANIVLAGLSISAATEKTKDDIRVQLGATITYTIDAAKYNNDLRSGLIDRSINLAYLPGTPTVANAIAISDYPEMIAADLIATIDFVGGDYVYFEYTPTTQTGGGNPQQSASNVVENASNLSVKTFTSLIPTDFSDQTSSLLTGRFATLEELETGALVALVESTFALNNQLGLSESFTVYSLDHQPIELTIIGIYQSNIVIDDRLARTACSSMLPQNQIYTPMATLFALGYTEETILSTTLSKAVYQLSDPKYLKSFAINAQNTINLVYGTLDLNDALYNQLTDPIDQLSNLSNLLVLIVIVAGASILGLVTALTVNSRKSEIGILLAIGESKAKVLTQLVVEVGTLVIIAFMLSTATGFQVANYISDQVSLSSTTTQSTQQIPQTGRGNASRLPMAAVGSSNVSPNIDVDLQVALNLNTIMQLLGAGLLITILGVSIPAINITRFKPKQILSNTI